MAITRVTLNGFRQETGTTARVYLYGFRQENSGSSGSSAALTGLAATSAITGPSVLHTQSLAGLEGTSAQTSPTAAHSNALAGLEAAVASGALSPALLSALVGAEIVVGRGELSAQTDAGTVAELTGQQATVAAGSPSLLHANDLAGIGASAAYGEFVLARLHPVTGQQADTALGAPTIARTSPLAGSEATAQYGNPSAAVSAAVLSALLTISQGALAADITQFARPASDISAGTWTPSTGVDLFATIDEAVVDDGDYDTSTNPAADVFEVKFGALVDPLSSTGHKLRYRLMAVDGTCDFSVQLRQGATTVIATWTHNGVTAVTTFEQTLSADEADTITDYTDLRLRFTATKV